MWDSLRVSLLQFSDDVVLLASSHECLQHALEWFAAEYEAVGIQISTSKSESMALSRQRMACPLQVGGENLPQVEEFEYLEVLFTNDGRRDSEISRRLGQVEGVMKSLYQFVVVKRELSHKAKLSIFQAVYIPIFSYGHELLIMTERMRSQLQAAAISFLCSVVGLTLHDRVRNSAIRERLKVEPLLLRIERSQFRWFVHLIRMSPVRLTLEVYRGQGPEVVP